MPIWSTSSPDAITGPSRTGHAACCTAVSLVIASAVLWGCTSRVTLLGDAPDLDEPVHDTSLDPAPEPPPPDAPVPEVVDILEEPPWPCTPEFAAQPRTIMGGLSASAGEEDDPDRPDLATLPSGEVWLSGRRWSSPSSTDTPKLTLVKVNPANALPGSAWHDLARNTDVDPYHPIAPLGDSLVIVYPDRGDFSANEILAMRMAMPPDSGELTAMPDTDVDSIQPAVASLGDTVAVVWRQPTGIRENAVIGFAIMDDTGAISHTGSIGDSDSDCSRPGIASGAGAWGVTYRRGHDTGWGFRELAPSGPTSLFRHSSTADMRGDVSVAWCGTHHALLFEHNHELTWRARMRFFYIGDPVETLDPTDSLEAAVGPLTADQPGMHDMAWNGTGFGVVWVHLDAEADRSRVWFFEMDTLGSIINGPHCLNPESTLSYNPSITWVENDEGWYYVFAWDEYSRSTGTHVLYTYSYGCSF